LTADEQDQKSGLNCFRLPLAEGLSSFRRAGEIADAMAFEKPGFFS
jgi:5,10-methenyltetrahydromethanopterin hydrogenase